MPSKPPPPPTREQIIDGLRQRDVYCQLHRRRAAMCILPDEVVWVCDKCHPRVVTRFKLPEIKKV